MSYVVYWTEIAAALNTIEEQAKLCPRSPRDKIIDGVVQARTSLEILTKIYERERAQRIEQRIQVPAQYQTDEDSPQSREC